MTTGVSGLAALLILGLAVAHAHDVTYKGTVIGVGDRTIEVQAIDDTTRQTSPIAFEITPKTRVYRGEAEVRFADAQVKKGERIVVTVNHEASMTQATVVRLAAR